MNEPQKAVPLRMLALIGSPKLAEKAEDVFRQSHLPFRYQLRGQGTASSETMDMLGLGGTTKVVSLAMMPKHFAVGMLERLDKELGLGRPGTGIAFTTAITGVNSPAMKLLDETIREEIYRAMEKDRKQMTEDSSCSLIVATVNQGFSEEVMEAAKSAGARGGTVLHARQTGGEETMKFWGIPIQEEKEMVLILAGTQTKMAVMKAVGGKYGLRSEARGILVSMPIDMIAGLDEE